MLIRGLRGLNAQLSAVTINAQKAGEAIGGEQLTARGGESVDEEAGETINTPRKPGEMRIGGMARGTSVGTAAKVLKEATAAKKSADKTIVKLEEMFGELSTFQEKQFKRMFEVSNEQYKGATLMAAIADILQSMERASKSRTPATATYQLLQRLDGILKAFELNFFGGRSGVTSQTFLSLLGNKKDSSSNGGLP